MPRLRRVCRPSYLRLFRAGHITLIASLVLLALPVPTPAEPILYMKQELPPIAYWQGTAHVTNQFAPEPPHAHTFVPAPPVFPPAFFQPPPLPTTPSVVWDSSFVIGESAPGSAFLYSAKPASVHLVDPDGDAGPGPTLGYGLTATVPEPPVIPGYVTGSIADSRLGQVAVHDGDDEDHQVVAMAAFWFKISLFGSVTELRGYVHGSVGIHLEGLGHGFGRGAILSGQEELPANDSTSVGVVPMVVDLNESSFTMLLMVNGITPDQLTSAQIYVGDKGCPGFPVVDLGQSAAWQPWPDGSGMTGFLMRAPFPQEFLDQLRNGQTYVELATLNFPAGEVRGQLEMPGH